MVRSAPPTGVEEEVFIEDSTEAKQGNDLIGYSSLSCLFRRAYGAIWASLVAQRLKPLPAMLETWVQSLSQEDPLEKEMATHSCILAWRIPWTEEPGGLQSTGSQRGTRLSGFTFTFMGLFVIGCPSVSLSPIRVCGLWLEF